MKLPYGPANLLLGIHLKKMKALIQKDTCTPVFIAALFTIAKIWKQPKCPPAAECIQKTGYECTCMCVCNGMLLLLSPFSRV